MRVGISINDAVKCSHHFVFALYHMSFMFNGLYKYSLIAKWLWSLCGGGSFERTIGVFNVQFHFGEIEVFFF